MDIERRQIGRMANLLPYLMLLLAASGLSATLLLHRRDLTFTSLIYVVPLVVGAGILFINKPLSKNILKQPVYVGKVRFEHLFLINSLILIVSLIISVSSPTRTLAYFILMAVFSGLILLQIFCQRPSWTNGLIIAEIIGLSLSLIWGTSLKYPLYFGDTDTLIHMHYIDTILTTNHIQTEDITYLNYPLYHIFNAIGIEITGLSIRNSLFIFMGLAWQAGILTSYLIFKELTKSSQFSAIACLITATSSQIIFYGSYAIARSLSLIFFIIWIYLIISKAKQSGQYLFLSTIVMLAMIMTHQANVILTIPILFLILVCQVIVNRFQRYQPLNPMFVILFSICTIAYLIWFATGLSSSTLVATLRSIFTANTGIRRDVTSGYGLSVITGAVYYSFALLAGLLGLRVILNHFQLNQSARAAGSIALAGFFLLAVYVPGPMDLLPVSDILMTNRFNLIASPFVALIMAYGIFYMNDNNISRINLRNVTLPILPAVFMILMTFFALVSTGNAQDYDHFPHTANIDTPYFTEAELSSFSFLQASGDKDLPLYSDYQTKRNDLSLSNFTNRYIIQSGDISYIQNGYLILRAEELQRKKALTFSPDGYGTNSYRYFLDQLNPQQNILTNLSAKNLIYSNGDVQISYIHNISGP